MNHVFESRTVTLNSGGEITLHLSVAFLSLSAADQDFVYDLLRKIHIYERSKPVGAVPGDRP